MKPAATVTTLFLLLIAVLHLTRLATRTEVLAGGAAVPMWVSIVAAIATAALATWLWREQRA
ncbi:MAG: hypothetical protein ACE5GX_12390 [Thermoanaerobaculia bacterium]